MISYVGNKRFFAAMVAGSLLLSGTGHAGIEKNHAQIAATALLFGRCAGALVAQRNFVQGDQSAGLKAQIVADIARISGSALIAHGKSDEAILLRSAWGVHDATRIVRAISSLRGLKVSEEEFEVNEFLADQKKLNTLLIMCESLVELVAIWGADKKADNKVCAGLESVLRSLYEARCAKPSSVAKNGYYAMAVLSAVYCAKALHEADTDPDTLEPYILGYNAPVGAVKPAYALAPELGQDDDTDCGICCEKYNKAHPRVKLHGSDKCVACAVCMDTHREAQKGIYKKNSAGVYIYDVVECPFCREVLNFS